MKRNIHGWSGLILSRNQRQSDRKEVQPLSDFHSDFSSDILNETIHNLTTVNFSENTQKSSQSTSNKMTDIPTGESGKKMAFQPTNKPVTQSSNLTTLQPMIMPTIAPTNEPGYAPSASPSNTFMTIVSLPQFEISLIFPSTISEEILASSSPIYMSTISVLEQRTSLYLSDTLDTLLIKNEDSEVPSNDYYSFQSVEIFISEPGVRHLKQKNTFRTHDNSNYFDEKKTQQFQNNHKISRKIETATISRQFIFNGHLIFDERVTPNENEILNALSSVLRDDGGSGLDGMRYLNFIKYSFDDILAKAIGVSVSVDGMDSFTALTEESIVSQQTTFEDTNPVTQSSATALKSVIIISCLVIFVALLSCLATCFSKRNRPRTKKVQVKDPQTDANTSVCISAFSCLNPCTSSINEDSSSSEENEIDDDSFFRELERARADELDNEKHSEMEENLMFGRGKHVSFHNKLAIIADDKNDKTKEELVWVDHNGEMRKVNAKSHNTSNSRSYIESHKRGNLLFDDANETFVPIKPSMTTNSQKRNHEPSSFQAQNPPIPSKKNNEPSSFQAPNPPVSPISLMKKHEPSPFQAQNHPVSPTFAMKKHEPSPFQAPNPPVSPKSPMKKHEPSPFQAQNHPVSPTSAMKKNEPSPFQAQDQSSTNPFQKFVHKQSIEDYKKGFSLESDSMVFFDHENDQNVFKPEIQKETHVWKELSNDNSLFQPVSLSNHTSETKIGHQEKVESNEPSTSPTDDITASTDRAYGNTTVSTKDLTNESTLSNNELKVVSDVLKELRKVSKFLNKRLNPRHSSGFTFSDSTTAVSETSNEMKSTIKTTNDLKNRLPPKVPQQKKSNGRNSKARLPKNIEIVPTTGIQPSVVSSLDGGSLTVGTLTNSVPVGTIDDQIQSGENSRDNDTIEGKVITAKSDFEKSPITGYAPLVTQEDSITSTNNLDTTERSSTSDYSETASDCSSSKESFEPNENRRTKYKEKIYARNKNLNFSQTVDETPLLGMKQRNHSFDNSEKEYKITLKDTDSNQDTRLRKDYELKSKTSFTEKFLQREVDAFFDDTGINSTGNTKTKTSVLKTEQVSKQIDPEIQLTSVRHKEQRDNTIIEETFSYKPYSIRSVTSEISAAFTINSTGEVVDKTKKREKRRPHHNEVEEESYVSDEDEIIVKDHLMNQAQQNIKLEPKSLEQEQRTTNNKNIGYNDTDGSASSNTSSSEFEGNEYLKPKELIPMFERIHPGPTRPPLHPHSGSWDNSIKTPRSSAMGTESMSKESHAHSTSTSSFREILGARPLKSSIQFTDLEVDSSATDSLKSESHSHATEKHDNSVEFSGMSSQSSSLPEGFFEKEVESLFTDNRPFYIKRKMIPHNQASIKQSQNMQFSQPPSFHYPNQDKDTIAKTSSDRIASNKRVIQRGPNQGFDKSNNKHVQMAVNVNYSPNTDDDSGVISGGEFPVNPIGISTGKHKTSPQNLMNAKNEKTMVISNKSKKYATAAVKMINKLVKTEKNEDTEHIGIASDRRVLTEKEEQLKASVLISMFEKKKW